VESSVLIYADTMRSAEQRHEVPLGIPDEFLYGSVDGRRFAVVTSFEVDRVRKVAPHLEVLPYEEFGWDELAKQGRPRPEMDLELIKRACRHFGIESAIVPPRFPVEVADFLRADGIDVKSDRQYFVARRRVKNEVELDGIKRAQRGAEAGMRAGLDLLRRAQANGQQLMLEGEPLTCERIKVAVAQAFNESGVSAEEFIVSHGPQTAVGHDDGSGPIAPNEPVLFDLFPRDRGTGCFADMSRTFVVGEPSEELRELHRLCREALERVVAEIKPGVKGRDLYALACNFFHEHGFPTQLHKQEGEVLESGFYHGLGHGVGLEVHEDPPISRFPSELVAGDVVAIEPGLYRAGYGGCRLEDIVRVTDHGAEVLTDFPYDLTP
jgi:Xaa-Pro aminopeptidase